MLKTDHKNVPRSRAEKKNGNQNCVTLTRLSTKVLRERISYPLAYADSTELLQAFRQFWE
jgi:ethanolamine utilization cobalamin adenosyltransferase